MSDFTSLEWQKQPTTSYIAHAIRKDTRKYRRERGRGGHRFSLNYVKSLWAASDGVHAVLNHIDDPAWQIWFCDPETGWALCSWHLTRREAQAVAENSLGIPLRPGTKGLGPGLYVLAGSDPGRPSIRTFCSSETSANDIEAVYVKLGFTTAREIVDPPVG
jgi:hypothetical protein